MRNKRRFYLLVLLSVSLVGVLTILATRPAAPEKQTVTKPSATAGTAVEQFTECLHVQEKHVGLEAFMASDHTLKYAKADLREEAKRFIGASVRITAELRTTDDKKKSIWTLVKIEQVPEPSQNDLEHVVQILRTSYGKVDAKLTGWQYYENCTIAVENGTLLFDTSVGYKGAALLVTPLPKGQRFHVTVANVQWTVGPFERRTQYIIATLIPVKD
ncbi:hypothetical protein COU77_03680 [Candidatus Peregrinibacteria bacterium CG10_big_fil_rev_8_21_14_0_10_49_16]|nr:MAG: hypothetical protein COU77_03680 [Candidatus Peregrinibacteria bacterium CG10_big_fil_rev_8_21_14_0_10_49_16]